MHIKDLLSQFSHFNHKIDRFELELIIAYIVDKPREFVLCHDDHKLNSSQINKAKSLVNKRILGIPLAQLTHQKEFFGLNFYINKNVLVPRPESEILVEKTIELSKNISNKQINIADIGTGSGCLAISLAKNIKGLKIHATDISNQALYVARKNAKLNHIKDAIIFYHGNMLKPLTNKKLDIIIANLPYIPTSYGKSLDKPYNQGLKFEPSTALYSGKDGLNHYKIFFKQLAELKFLPKFILIEIDPSQVSKLKKITLGLCPQSHFEIICDLNQKDRFILLSLN